MGPYACRSCYGLAYATQKARPWRLQRENPPGPHVFVSERGGPGVTPSWFRKMVARLGKRADNAVRHPFAYARAQLRL
jgi:hypothetical protein